jgi:beta-lactam-binding protein with PASTA domain
MKRLSVLFTLFIFLFTPLAVRAYPYSSILSFGDSLSDNGPPDGFGIMHYTNGPVWVEYMASHYSVPLLDMSYGGATTGVDDPAAGSPILGLQWQVSTYLNNISPIVPSNTLVTIWAGANDFLQGRAPNQAASNVALAIMNLANAGAQNFFINNLPDLGLTPQFRGTPFQAQATAWSQAFNADLAMDLQTVELAYSADNFYTLDTFDLLDAVIAYPILYGFTNVTENGNQNPPPGYLFWDTIHPTTSAHLLLAQYAEAEASLQREPNVVGMIDTDAENALKAAGLVVGAWDSQYSSTVPINHIISQDPPAGTYVPVGSSVTLTTSLGPQPTTVIVPNVVGMTKLDGTLTIVWAGLKSGYYANDYSTTVPAGCVISTNPVAGTSVAQGTFVLLKISLGPHMVKVPNVVGMTQAAASRTLGDYFLPTGTITQAYSSTVASGSVISQSIASGTSVLAGTAVDLTISKGPQPVVMVTVPNVVGMTKLDGTLTIVWAGLKSGYKSSYSTTVPAGCVISTQPVAGTSVAQGTFVLLTISVGPPK